MIFLFISILSECSRHKLTKHAASEALKYLYTTEYNLNKTTHE